jgi:protein-disulfide isomerase
MTSDTRSARLLLPVSQRDHIQGPSDAAVTLVEYGDYQCPYCGRAYPIVQAVQQRLGDRLRFVFRHFPLTQVHPHAQHAAEAAEAAAAQGAFWAIHDALFEQQRHLDDDHLVQYARQLGLHVGAFETALASHAHAGRVREDFLSGARSGVNGTPTFFINGVRHDAGYDVGTLLRAIERAEEATRLTAKDRP